MKPAKQLRFCNRCNKRMQDRVIDEMFCDHCGCPEFRLVDRDKLSPGESRWKDVDGFSEDGSV